MPLFHIQPNLPAAWESVVNNCHNIWDVGVCFHTQRMNKPLVEIVAYSASVSHANVERKTPVEFNHSAPQPTRDEQLSHAA